MRTMHSQDGDSLFVNCLFLHLRNHQMTLKNWYFIKPTVLLIETDYFVMIVKKFSHQGQLELQKEFLEQLQQLGFQNGYCFVKNIKPFFFQNQVYGFLHYIVPHQQQFTLQNERDHQIALTLLDEFHQYSAKLVDRFSTLLPQLLLQKKWQERLTEFCNHLSSFQNFMGEAVVNQYMMMGKTTLANMIQFSAESSQSNVIIHGDVAHHNFLRDQRNNLQLIDFDLIAIAPAMVEMIQYANRILPLYQWKLEEIWQFPQIQRYQKNRFFLAALAYPADIFREWNRFYREKSWNHLELLIFLKKISNHQFSLRNQFFNKIQSMIQ